MPDPPVGLDVRETVLPTQTGPLFMAEMSGAGLSDTLIVVVAVAVQPALSVTVTVYVPVAVKNARILAGFCALET